MQSFYPKIYGANPLSSLQVAQNWVNLNAQGPVSVRTCSHPGGWGTHKVHKLIPKKEGGA